MKKFLQKLLLPLLVLCALIVFAACGEEVPQAETATITYDTGVEGLTLPSLTSRKGGKIYPPDDPVREGYRFDGWLLDGSPFVFDVMPDRDVTLTALWTKYYTLSFDVSSVPSQPYAEGEEIVLPDPPQREHFLFDHWELDGEPFSAGNMPARDLTLKAVWNAAVTIDFVTGASDCTIAPIVAVAGDPIEAPKVNRRGFHLNSWRTAEGDVFTFSVMPEEDLTLYADWMELTNLPALFIDLYDGDGNSYPLSSVEKENYVESTVSVENTDDEYLLSGVKAGFRGRGNGSWWDIPYDKKGYKIKFDKKQSLFGEEANKHWVIIACVSTPYPETTMSRNYLAYNMANEVFDGIEYTTSARWIDVYINGEYRGVYLLCEHVRVDEGRVDIPSDYLTSDYGNTGYLIEYDCYAADGGTVEGVDYFRVNGMRYPFTVHSPDPEDVRDGKAEVSSPAFMNQIAWLKEEVQKLCNAALSSDWAAFCELADADSFLDMYLLHELFKNTDTGYSSFYIYKKPNGKFFAGPAWDFDATCMATGQSPEGIYVAADRAGVAPNEIYVELYRNSAFRRAVAERWKEVSPKIKTFLDERLNDTVYAEYRAAMGKNYAKWLGRTQQAAETQWVIDVKALKLWLLQRAAWLDGEWS